MNTQIEGIQQRRALQPPPPWKWESDKLIAADGTVILWAVADCYGKKYIGAQADCDDFIASSPADIDHLLAEVGILTAQLAQANKTIAELSGYVADNPPVYDITAEQAKRLLDAVNVPSVTDVYRAGSNIFYASFIQSLYPDDVAMLKAVGFEVNTNARSPLRHRYMLTYHPAPADR